MKKLLLLVSLFCTHGFAELPAFEPKTLDEAIALLNRDGLGPIAVTNVPTQLEETSTQIKTDEFTLTVSREGKYRSELFLISSTRLGHPYTFSTNALTEKLEAAGFTSEGNGEWKLSTETITAETRFGGVAVSLWAKKPEYYELTIRFQYKDLKEPKTKETIKLW